MIIDIIVLIVALVAAFKGYRKGLIVAFFSFVGLIIVLAAGVPLSVQAAKYIGVDASNTKPWQPMVIFLLVAIIIMLLMRWVARLVTAALNWPLLGGMNRLVGACLFLLVYLTIISILFFYVSNVNLLPVSVIKGSHTVSYMQWWAPKSIELLSTILPFLKNSFIELKKYFAYTIPTTL